MYGRIVKRVEHYDYYTSVYCYYSPGKPFLFLLLVRGRKCGCDCSLSLEPLAVVTTLLCRHKRVNTNVTRWSRLHLDTLVVAYLRCAHLLSAL